jgi:hypothetical protein
MLEDEARVPRTGRLTQLWPLLRHMTADVHQTSVSKVPPRHGGRDICGNSSKPMEGGDLQDMQHGSEHTSLRSPSHFEAGGLCFSLCFTHVQIKQHGAHFK